MKSPFRERAIELLKSGCTDREVAERLEIPRRYLVCLRRQLRMPPNNPRNRPWTDAERLTVVEHYTRPRPKPGLVDLAYRLGRTIASVKQAAGKLRRAGKLRANP